MRSGTRHAFTARELLLLLLVAAVGLGLVLPWLRQARAAEQRVACADRLKSLALAMHQYEDQHGGLPHRRTMKPYYQGFGVTLLPFLGAEKLSKAYRYDRHFLDAANQPVIITPVAAFQCPASPPNRTVELCDMTGKPVGTKGATSDYFLPNSARDSGLPATLQSNQRTALLDDRIMPSSLCTDGKSQTLLLFEMAGRPDHWIAGTKQAERRQAHAGWWGAWAAWNATQVWSYSADGTDNEGPCTINCNNEHGPYGFHRDGAHCVLVDGSVRLLSPKLDRYVLFALVTRDGGEMLSDTDF